MFWLLFFVNSKLDNKGSTFIFQRLKGVKWQQTDDLTIGQKVGRKTLWIIGTSEYNYCFQTVN